MEYEFLCMLIDADRDDHEFFRIALMKTQKKVKCLYFYNCLEADLYLITPGSDIPNFIFVDTYDPVLNEEYCLSNIKEWKSVLPASIIIYSAFLSAKLFTELKRAGIQAFLMKTITIADLVSQLDEIIV